MNRADHVDRLLESLSWSRVPRDEFEVIVCDDGGADRTREVVFGWRQRGLDVSYVRARESGPPRNNAAARNVGLQVARYRIVLNTDSDSVFVTDALAAMRRHIGDGVFCSCARYYTLTRDAMLEIEGIGRDRALEPDDYAKRIRGRPNQVDSPDGVHALHGAFACWRDVLDAIGGYDEGFTEWGWEDRELLSRLESYLGLTRRFVEGVTVVHQWHPPGRGVHRRDELARSGEISSRALQRQLQRVRAVQPECARWREAGRWSIRSHDSTLVFTPRHYADVLDSQHGPAERRWRLLFDAQTLEAEVLRLEGFPDLARRFSLYTLTRPWERAQPTARWQDHAVGRDDAMLVHAAQAAYPRLSDLVETLAECELDLGSFTRADHVLATLKDCPGGRLRVARIRARYTLRTGAESGLAVARELVDAALKVEPSVSLTALGVELALLTDDRDHASNLTIDGLDPRMHRLDMFDWLLLHAYLEHLHPSDAKASAVPDQLRTDHDRWLYESSEHLYSVAIRATRQGLDTAAAVLLTQFLEGGAPADPRLFREGTAALAATRNRLEARATRSASRQGTDALTRHIPG